MTKSKEELIAKINRVVGEDRTEELRNLKKHELLVIIDRLEDTETNPGPESDLSSMLGSSFRRITTD